MVIERNQMIYQIHLDHPEWTLQKIAEFLGISKQRVSQIVQHCSKNDIISNMTDIKYPRITEPLSLTQASKLTGIPNSTISMWIKRGFVIVEKKANHKRACTGDPILINPVSLQERIDNYHPRQKKVSSTN